MNFYYIGELGMTQDIEILIQTFNIGTYYKVRIYYIDQLMYMLDITYIQACISLSDICCYKKMLMIMRLNVVAWNNKLVVHIDDV